MVQAIFVTEITQFYWNVAKVYLETYLTMVLILDGNSEISAECPELPSNIGAIYLTQF